MLHLVRIRLGFAALIMEVYKLTQNVHEKFSVLTS